MPPDTPIETAESDVISLSSVDFMKAFIEDQSAATRKFRNKTIELHGTVASVGIGTDGTTGQITLSGFEGKRIRCKCVDAQPWNSVRPGNEVIVHGTLPLIVTRPSLDGCEIVEVEGEKAPVYTSEDIVQKFTTDEVKAKTEFDKHHVIIEGAVSNIDDFGNVFLKGNDKKSLRITAATFAKDQLKGLRVGDELRVLGTFGVNSFDYVEFRDCLRFVESAKQPSDPKQ